jgi:carbon starvation protein
MGNRFGPWAVWAGVALGGAVCWGVLALSRGETVNAGWMLFAAIASYAIAYRFYSRFIANRVLGVDDNRATPGEKLDNGRDFEPMDRRILFGHHFAAIAGAGPLVGPVLAAQMGFLPGTVWIIVGVILAGAVQDMTILFFSMRRDGKTLGQMAREEIGPVGGAAALVAVFHHGHPTRRAGARRGQRPGQLAVGLVLHRDDPPDRAPHGLLPALLETG